MNVLSTIVIDVEKFFKNTGSALERFAASFQKLFGKAPAALQAVQNFVGMVAPVITAAVALADPVVEPEVAAALATAETGLAAIDAAATAAATGTSLLTELQNFAATVPQLLTGLDIKNANLKATITKIVTLVTGEAKVLIPAVEAWVAQIKATTPPVA
jgi:phage-related tail protein